MARVLSDFPRFFDQHDRDAIADRIRKARLVRDQLLPRSVIAQRHFRHRTDEDFQKLRVNFCGHRKLISDFRKLVILKEHGD